VWGLIFVLFPISFPISKILDCVIGNTHDTYFRRAELHELVSIHQELELEENPENSARPRGGPLTMAEVKVIKGAMAMVDKNVIHCCTPLDEVFMLPASAKLDKPTLKLILKNNHSRIPIYRDNRTHIIGMILTKSLILMDPVKETPVDKCKLVQLPSVNKTMPLFSMLDCFQTGKSHMAVVLDDKDNITPLGIITLEDVIEELIQEEIEDEADLLRKSDSYILRSLSRSPDVIQKK